MSKIDTLQQLLSGETVSLASWVANPVPRQQAKDCLPGILHQLQASVADGRGSFAVHIAELVVRYWCGHNLDAAFQNLFALQRERREQALLKLCYGQLLMACRPDPASQSRVHGYAGLTFRGRVVQDSQR